MSKPFISIVVPVFGDGFNAGIFYKEIEDALSSWAKFEVVFVNDSFEDENWESIKNLEGVADNIIAVCNGKNRGQHFSTMAGLERVNGDYVVVSDCDGQDNPFEIKKMFDHLTRNQLDAVFGQRLSRASNFFASILSRCFYLILNLLTKFEYDYRTTSFGITTKKIIKCLIQKKSKKIIYGISIRLLTKKIGLIGIEHRARRYGFSSYSFFAKLRLGFDIFNLIWSSRVSGENRGAVGEDYEC